MFKIVLALCFLGIIACSDPFKFSDIEKNSEKNSACEIDADCVGNWWVGRNSCGSSDRCIDQSCQIPLAMSGHLANKEYHQLFDRMSCVFAMDDSMEEMIVERYVEWARGEFALNRGLMCRDDMLDDWAMALVFPLADAQNITMHLMQFPIVLIVLGEDGKVLDLVRLETQEAQDYVSPEGTLIVVEMKADGFEGRIDAIVGGICVFGE